MRWDLIIFVASFAIVIGLGSLMNRRAGRRTSGWFGEATPVIDHVPFYDEWA